MAAASSVAVLLLCETARGEQKFYPDDPVWKMPAPLPLKAPHTRKIDQLYDFVLNSAATPGEKQLPGHLIPAADVNTLGEVPDSTWYTNRQYRHRMSIEELRRGPVDQGPPSPPFRIVGTKTEGITPGFQMEDSKGRRYLCKPDPESDPEMATAADVIGSKFFYAFGYNVPQNFILYVTPEQLSIDASAKVAGVNGKERALNGHDLHHILLRVPRDQQGRYRFMASFHIPGKAVGPFRWYGVRRDDPEDFYLHENRRALRGLYVFCSWLNHTDIKANNTYDAIQKVEGNDAIVHYLIDFGASLGSDSDEAKNARFGHEYMIEKDKKVLLRMAAGGFYSPDWERANFPDIPGVGHFEAETFHAGNWTSNYPNAAFLNRLPDDIFWAAKQVMAFTREEIRAMVETGEFSDPKAVDYIAGTLEKRQQKIGRYAFSQVLPLDHFAVRDGKLLFEDLGAKYGFSPPRDYRVKWHRFDNTTSQSTPIESAASMLVPREQGYLMAEISGSGAKLIRVYVHGQDVVGIERTW